MYIYIYIYVYMYIYIYIYIYVLFSGSRVPAFLYERVREKGAEPKTVPEAELVEVNADCRVATWERKKRAENGLAMKSG